MSNSIQQLTERVALLTTTIVNHPLYSNISSILHLQRFMEQHVFAVWDFMCLLKELHRRIVSTAAPWFPPKDPLSANLISSILVEEEGDLTEDGVTYASHYDMYITAMENIGADTAPIKKLLYLLGNGSTLHNSINNIPISQGSKNFVLSTFSFFERELHEIAAAFVYGREGITAAMFLPIVTQLEQNYPQQHQLSTLIYYFKRHIELDNDEHFPKALKMLSNLIGDDAQKLQQAENAAITALTARINFLTSIQQSLLMEKSVA